jgi:hypothetical protein
LWEATDEGFHVFELLGKGESEGMIGSKCTGPCTEVVGHSMLLHDLQDEGGIGVVESTFDVMGE